MPQYGLLLRVTHTGKAGDSVHVSDIRDGVDVLASFRKAGPVYVPTPAKGGVAVLVYSGDVAISFETGGIRKFIEGGYLTADFIIGSTLAPALFPEVRDEGVLVDPATTLFDFTGAGVTATQTAPGQVQVDIPGGGSADHATLSNLNWLLALHTGTINTIAGFNGARAPRYYQIGVDLQAWDADLDALAALATTGLVTRTGPATFTTTSTTVTGDVTGTFPGPLSVGDFTLAGQVRGDVLFFDGVNWVVRHPGVSGEVLTTQGVGADPIWTSAGSTQLLWGANTVSSTPTTRYLFPSYDGGLAQTVVIQIRMVRAGTLRNLRVRHNVPSGNGNPIVYTVRVNGVGTALTVSLASTGTDGSDLVNTAVVAAGDLVDIEIIKAASIVNSPSDVVATVEFI